MTMTRRFAALIALAGLFAVAQPAPAHDFTKGALTIDHPIVAPIKPPRQVTAGYFTIINKGGADRLLSASSPSAKTVEIHTHRKGEGGMMRMEMVKGGVKVPAKGKVAFKPGGLHLMLFGVSQEIKEGDPITVTLVFEKAGAVEVVAMGEMPSLSGSGHKH
jgi:periplasmic copper chaperone A